MALRISDWVVGGEIICTRKNSVHGFLNLRGVERLMILNLTGNPAPDLAGKHLRFKLRGYEEDESEFGPFPEDGTAPEAPDLSGVAWQQIGPTGVMTAARRVKVSDCPPAELYRRCKLDEPPPFVWKPCLTLEWYSQNGRVLVELVDPEMEFVETDAEPSRANAGPADPASAEAFDMPTPDGDEDFVAAFEDSDSEDSDEFDLFDSASLEECEDEDSCDGCDESWSPISKELQEELDAQARELDRACGRDTETDDLIHELELMDNLIAKGEGEPIGTLFDDVVKTPSPDSLDEAGAEVALKSLLAQLALLGISLDMCEHFTAKEAYRLLVEQVCKEDKAYPELRGTQWVQHFSTHDYCPVCQAEFEQGYQARPPEEGESPQDA
ncbi:MAG TPA: hypothetical protein PKG54_06290 [Phycisphaerae bacterium]|nr:hypothetical protein [Phycisphaerae bacterium]HOB74118.1 hypothetical protein [Phycisphaerae bacterium]HOJ56136.1 hypothetical protein [Phycisphaerae bacterium]HOL28050.1 hypothetical protein [Phycisphaerae bacterium]HPP22310.1 hypothetical protein [Phycisphaerae bacterium]